jgi:hypothetical protein
MITLICAFPVSRQSLPIANECTGQVFDFNEETLTKDWIGLRTYLDELGIKPTISYTTQPMGNPTGGLSQGVHGLSLHVLAAWSSDRNLSLDFVGTVPKSSLFEFATTD